RLFWSSPCWCQLWERSGRPLIPMQSWLGCTCPSRSKARRGGIPNRCNSSCNRVQSLLGSFVLVWTVFRPALLLLERSGTNVFLEKPSALSGFLGVLQPCRVQCGKV